MIAGIQLSTHTHTLELDRFKPSLVRTSFYSGKLSASAILDNEGRLNFFGCSFKFVAFTDTKQKQVSLTRICTQVNRLSWYSSNDGLKKQHLHAIVDASVCPMMFASPTFVMDECGASQLGAFSTRHLLSAKRILCFTTFWPHQLSLIRL